MNFASQPNIGFPDMRINMERQEEPCGQQQGVLLTFPETNSGFLVLKPNLISWPEQNPSFPDQLALGKMEVPSQTNSGFSEVEVKLEEEEKPCGLLKQESQTFTDMNSGFPDLVIKEEELCSQGSVESTGIAAGQSDPSQRWSPTTISSQMRLQLNRGRNAIGHRGENMAVTMMQQANEDAHLSARTRGTAWRHLEVRDLLDIWGDSKVQEDLRASHRNLDIFESIAQEMRNRGHQRSAGECRTKTKALRLEYRRVVAHNSLNAKDKVTCPYYRELHKILGGDASVAPKRVCRKLRLNIPIPPTTEHRQVLDNSGLHTIDATQILEGTSQIPEPGSFLPEGENRTGEYAGASHSSQQVASITAIIESDEGSTPAAQLQESTPNSPESLWEPSQRRNPVRMSPHTRLQLARGRKTTGRRGESIAVAMMQQQSEDAHLSRRMRRKEHLELMGAVKESNLMMRELVNAFKEENATSAAQTEEVLQDMRTGTAVFSQMLNLLKNLQPNRLPEQTGTVMPNTSSPPVPDVPGISRDMHGDGQALAEPRNNNNPVQKKRKLSVSLESTADTDPEDLPEEDQVLEVEVGGEDDSPSQPPEEPVEWETVLVISSDEEEGAEPCSVIAPRPKQEEACVSSPGLGSFSAAPQLKEEEGSVSSPGLGNLSGGTTGEEGGNQTLDERFGVLLGSFKDFQDQSKQDYENFIQAVNTTLVSFDQKIARLDQQMGVLWRWYENCHTPNHNS